MAQWLARSAVNRKVGGSIPPGGVLLFLISNKLADAILFTLLLVERNGKVSKNRSLFSLLNVLKSRALLVSVLQPRCRDTS